MNEKVWNGDLVSKSLNSNRSLIGMYELNSSNLGPIFQCLESHLSNENEDVLYFTCKKGFLLMTVSKREIKTYINN